MSDPARILITDDEDPIRKFLRISLSQANYQVQEASTGREAIAHTASFNPDLILLDLGLPDQDGLSVIQQLREWTLIPIIILSARGNELDKVQALDLGANDYLTKPFSVAELLARIRAILRVQRDSIAPPAKFDNGTLRIDFATREVFSNSTLLHLTPTEYSLLVLMVRHAGKVLTHKQILGEIWGPAYQKRSQYLRVFINQLRKKIEPDSSVPRMILTEPGVGYRFKSLELT